MFALAHGLRQARAERNVISIRAGSIVSGQKTWPISRRVTSFLNRVLIRGRASMTALVYKKIGVALILFGMAMGSFMGYYALGPIILGAGLVVSPLIIEFSTGFVRHAHKTALDEWNGSYYQWGHRQIRIIEMDGIPG